MSKPTEEQVVKPIKKVVVEYYCPIHKTTLLLASGYNPPNGVCIWCNKDYPTE